MSEEFALKLAEEQIVVLRKSIAQLEDELKQRRTQIQHLQPVYLEVCEENAKLKNENERMMKLAHDYIAAYEKLAFGDQDG